MEMPPEHFLMCSDRSCSERSNKIIMEELLDILQDIRDDVDYETEDELVTGKILNSFEILQIVSEINDAFDIEIPASEVVPENFNSVSAMEALIRKLS